MNQVIETLMRYKSERKEEFRKQNNFNEAQYLSMFWHIGEYTISSRKKVLENLRKVKIILSR